MSLRQEKGKGEVGMNGGKGERGKIDWENWDVGDERD